MYILWIYVFLLFQLKCSHLLTRALLTMAQSCSAWLRSNPGGSQSCSGCDGCGWCQGRAVWHPHLLVLLPTAAPKTPPAARRVSESWRKANFKNSCTGKPKMLSQSLQRTSTEAPGSKQAVITSLVSLTKSKKIKNKNGCCDNTHQLQSTSLWKKIIQHNCELSNSSNI